MNKILKVARRLKILIHKDIIMFCEIYLEEAKKFLLESENIKDCGYQFEYVEIIKVDEKYKIIDENIACKNSDITVIEACKLF